MDRYLFRGKRIDNGEWVYGGIDIERNGVQWIYDKELPYDNEVAVFPETVGQCTGLYAAKSYRGDSDDARMVFEGDIIKFEHPSPDVKNGIGVVVWNEDELAWEFRDPDLPEWYNGYAGEMYEIIGNRFDHPELLGGKKEEAE